MENIYFDSEDDDLEEVYDRPKRKTAAPPNYKDQYVDLGSENSESQESEHSDYQDDEMDVDNNKPKRRKVSAENWIALQPNVRLFFFFSPTRPVPLAPQSTWRGTSYASCTTPMTCSRTYSAGGVPILAVSLWPKTPFKLVLPCQN
jgi:hypothetical protein